MDDRLSDTRAFCAAWFASLGAAHAALQWRLYGFAFDGAWDGLTYVGFWCVAGGLVGCALGAGWDRACRLAGLRAWLRALSVVPAAISGGLFAMLWLGLVGKTWPQSARATAAAAVLGAFASGVVAALVLKFSRKLTLSTGRGLWIALLCAGVAMIALAAVAPSPASGAQDNRQATGLGPSAKPQSEAVPPGPQASALKLPRGTNVLLILVDTLRADHLPTWGYARDTGPFSRDLADRGIVFSQTIAQATRTSPNMASLLTSTRVYTHGIIEARSELSEDALTWGEILRQHGYRTVALVANPNVGERFRFTQGFEIVKEFFEKGKDRAEILELVSKPS